MYLVLTDCVETEFSKPERYPSAVFVTLCIPDAPLYPKV